MASLDLLLHLLGVDSKASGADREADRTYSKASSNKHMLCHRQCSFAYACLQGPSKQLHKQVIVSQSAISSGAISEPVTISSIVISLISYLFSSSITDVCRFTKSVIRSKAALSYAEAQARMDDERVGDEITLGLRRMNSLAKIMRKRRFDRGALALASPEVKFEMDSETLDPLDVAIYQVSCSTVLNTSGTIRNACRNSGPS